MKLNTIDDCDFAETAERQRAGETVGRRAPARGYCRPQGGTGGRGTTNGQPKGGKGLPRAFTRAYAVYCRAQCRAPPAAGMGREKEHRRRMAKGAREWRVSARDEPPADARRGCRR